MPTAIGLARLVRAPPFVVEMPTVVAAADPGLVDLTVEQRRAPMAAPRVQQPDLAVAAAVHDEVLAQDAEGPREVGRLGGAGYRLPVPPQQLPSPRSPTDPYEILANWGGRQAIRGADVPAPLSHARGWIPDRSVHGYQR